MEGYEENHRDALPPGFRFHPTDEELITYYLLKKVLDGSFVSRAIAEVDLNKSEPWHLPGKAKMGEKEWYFFSLRDRKYPTGLRTNRATEAGYWKATGKDREIYSSKTGSLVGMKKTLVFYRGRAPKGEKSNWVMHEYRLEGKFAYHYLSRNAKGEWVISRVFQKSGAGVNAGKKRSSVGMPEISSPSSVSLPPLLEAPMDRESCSFDGVKEHVPCFSTAPPPPPAVFNHYSLFEIPAPPTPYQSLIDPNSATASTATSRFGKSSVVGFPSLRSLQETLHLPNNLHHHHHRISDLAGPITQWMSSENPRLGTSAGELDCMWDI
ncbi:hypothetical protein M569_11104 [Genlisea aurea]|uniref:NAC domain-containing protein n=1 Tax=Genlisea aurea TaxID=192259 RepID=S8DUU5_9LAMI|nr:hypothetical protein M569_11104 [Genlisea aurea]